MKGYQNHWAYKELEKKLKNQPTVQPIEEVKELPEFGTLFLVNPQMREEIDCMIHEKLWPAVLKGVEGSNIEIYEQQKAPIKIRDTRSPELTRELIFLLEDPARPIGPANDACWYVRGTLECHSFFYMLKFDLILEFPMMFDLKALVRLMGDSRLRSIPPTLSVEEAGYVLQMSWGHGGQYGSPHYEPERFITKSIEKHLDIIKAMDKLVDDFNSGKLFRNLSNKIIAFYGE